MNTKEIIQIQKEINNYKKESIIYALQYNLYYEEFIEKRDDIFDSTVKIVEKENKLIKQLLADKDFKPGDLCDENEEFKQLHDSMELLEHIKFKECQLMMKYDNN